MSELLATGLGHPEGPDVLADGSIIFVETYTGKLLRYFPGEGQLAEFCVTGGGPNACLRGSDGRVYVTQSGGTVGSWSANDGVPGCLQVADMNGTVRTLTAEIGDQRLNAPNDLAFGPDGALYFTDSGRFDPDRRPDDGLIYRLDPDGSGEQLVNTGRTYPNGIVVENDGSVVWVETYTRAVMRRSPAGEVEKLCILPEGHGPDGFKIDAEGNFWITVTGAGGLDVVAPDGTYLRFFETGGVPLNCCFDGSDIIITDFGTTDTTSGEAAMVGTLQRVNAERKGQAVFRGAIKL